MPDTPRNYSISADFPGGAVNTTKLRAEILASSITTVLNRIDTDGNTISIVFNAALTAGEATTLDNDVTGPAGGLIATHDNTAWWSSVMASTSNPTVNDDVSMGVILGGIWINTTTDLLWHCLDASAGAAVWVVVPSAAQMTKLDGIETAADVTDATNVAAAGATMDSDFSASEGFMRKISAGTYEVIKSNLSATTDPGTTDDTGSGYAVGSRWANVTLDKEFVCLDATTSAAVWKETTGGGGGDPTSDIAEASGDITTTSTTDVLATSMTLTPASGNYLVWFSTSVTNDGAGDSTFINIYSGGTFQASSDRERTLNRADDSVGLAAMAKVTVNGSQAIEGRWRVNAGTGTMHERTLILLKVA